MQISPSLLSQSVQDNSIVRGLTHDFYRYPARFSPQFVRGFISKLTSPGDTVIDCFMGGGTTAVEALTSGRNFLGSDLNSLAIFLAKVKTSILTKREKLELAEWAEALSVNINLRQGEMPSDERATRIPWNLRKTLGLSIASTENLQSNRAKRFARCSLLRTAQWAIDCTRDPKSKAEFLLKHQQHFRQMLQGINEYQSVISTLGARRPEKRIFQRPASEIEVDALGALKKASLLITSPPYPGVHVLYHRWQIEGRRETAAPYWVADCADGQPSSYYTLSSRRPKDWDQYMLGITDSFAAMRDLLLPDARVVQLVAFSDPIPQYELYLAAMAKAGYKHENIPDLGGTDAPVTRDVPNRKWYAQMQGVIPASKEYVLVHSRAKER